MPRKIRDLIKDLRKFGFQEIPRAGKGSYKKFIHINYKGAVTLSGKDNDDAKPYQEKMVKQVIEKVIE